VTTSSRSDESLVRTTTSGPVRGLRNPETVGWRGIAYAAAPVGALRLRAPAPAPVWSEVRDATRFGPIAPQSTRGPGAKAIDDPGMSEDCLTLNVTAPATSGTSNRPVMVWFHGGGYTIGSSAQAIYHGDSLVTEGDLVLVTVNYRLGALGYLDLSCFATAERPIDSNLGLRDQVAALSWVRDNIAAFGGDPDRVTIFGESAGANSVVTLFATPAARGLFSAGIAQSSTPPSVGSTELRTGVARDLARTLGADPDDAAGTQSRLLSATTAELVAALHVLGTYSDTMPGTSALSPVVDGDYLPMPPLSAFEDGSAAAVPLLIGCNAREGTLFQRLKPLDHLPTNQARIERMFQLTQPELRDQVLAAYPDYPAKSAMADVGGDVTFVVPSSRVADAHARRAPVWHYRFDGSTRLLDLLGLGAIHGSELGLVFGDVDSGAERIVGVLGGRRGRRDLSTRMQRLWLDFAHDADPGPSWPAYTEERRATMLFEPAGDRVVDDPLAHLRAAWSGYIGW
jgi:para-nitrobenzyl esterase